VLQFDLADSGEGWDGRQRQCWNGGCSWAEDGGGLESRKAKMRDMSSTVALLFSKARRVKFQGGGGVILERAMP
jgi:hypothetical protein